MGGIQRLCREYGTLLVMDEVACGFGRTGRLFASEHFGIEPDILCLGKAITAGYAGMGATVVTPRVADEVGDRAEFWSTYGWHPLAVDAALANLRLWKRRGASLLKGGAAESEYLRGRLSEMEFAHQAQINGRGLAIGLEVGSEQYAEELQARCREGGLLVSAEDEPGRLAFVIRKKVPG